MEEFLPTIKFDPTIHHRRSIRLKGYDYSQPGAYFVTCVANQRQELFGEIAKGSMRLNQFGEILCRSWLDLPRHYPNAILDAFVIMPNHVHGIVILRADDGLSGLNKSSGGVKIATHDWSEVNNCRGGSDTDNEFQPDGMSSCDDFLTDIHETRPYHTTRPYATIIDPVRHGLPEIIRAFKSFSARCINRLRKTPGTPIWQRNYYEHVIRDQPELDHFRLYILENPRKWSEDRENIEY